MRRSGEEAGAKERAAARGQKNDIRIQLDEKKDRRMEKIRLELSVSGETKATACSTQIYV